MIDSLFPFFLFLLKKEQPFREKEKKDHDHTRRDEKEVDLLLMSCSHFREDLSWVPESLESWRLKERGMCGERERS
jgi:hypothetical protein